MLSNTLSGLEQENAEKAVTAPGVEVPLPRSMASCRGASSLARCSMAVVLLKHSSTPPWRHTRHARAAPQSPARSIVDPSKSASAGPRPTLGDGGCGWSLSRGAAAWAGVATSALKMAHTDRVAPNLFQPTDAPHPKTARRGSVFPPLSDPPCPAPAEPFRFSRKDPVPRRREEGR